jgi:hypothetical protein
MRSPFLIALLLLLASGCSDRRLEPAGFVDRFDRKELGTEYFDPVGRWAVYRGRLNVSHAYNHPLWLKRRLPRDVVIELDALAHQPDGDLKVEVRGDGRSFVDHRGAYVGTGYILCFGGWKNTKSFIARQVEHPPQGREAELMSSRTDVKVEPGKTYHWRIVLRGPEIRWEIDGKEFLSFVDRRPLQGPGHEHFGFGNWEAEASFDNLVIRPLR